MLYYNHNQNYLRVIAIQLLAILTMLIDHIGYLFFPEQLSWRIIGRIAMPIYTYALVLGYHRTRNLPSYFKRIAVIAILSQLPYMAAFHVLEINVVGTLLICLLLLWLMDHWSGRPALQGIAIVLILALLEIIPCDYGSYAAILVLIYRYAPKKTMLLAHLLLNIVFFYTFGWYVQLFSLSATFILFVLPEFVKALDKVHIPRLLWRSFYPAHLLLLAAVYWFMNEV